jgi:hypothetical protein
MVTTATATQPTTATSAYRLEEGAPAVGWQPATHWRRFSAWVLDLALFAVTLDIGWSMWVWRDWARGRLPASRCSV